MTRAEAELHSIRTTIEAYQMILKNKTELSEDDKNKIRKKINELGKIRDKILSEIYYGLWIIEINVLEILSMEKLIAKYLIEDLIIEIKQLKENKSVEYKIACDDIINLIEKHCPYND